MSFKLDIFISIAVLIVAPWGGGVHAQKALPVRPVATIKLLQPIQQITAVELKPLELEPFHYAPMGTYPNPYPAGQCTSGVASMKGNIPVWGNAADWAANARGAGYTVSDVPIVGAVAQHGGGLGHVGVVVGVRPGEILLTEMNYDWNGSVRTTWEPVGLYQYIYI